MARRIDEFEGTTDEYIAFLESEVKAARQHRCPPIAEPSTTPAKKRWENNALALVNATPIAVDWQKAIHEAGLYEVISSGEAARHLLDHHCPLPSSSSEACPSGLAARVRFYAQSTCQRRRAASLAIRLANFQEFLLLSACVVLTATEQVPDEDVWDIVRIATGCKTERHCQRMLDTAVYVNRVIDTLNAHDWGYRGADLILLCKPVCL